MLFPTDLASFLELIRQHGDAAYSLMFAYAGAHSLLLTLFAGWTSAGKVLFGASLILMMLSLLVSLWEIQLSVNALNIQLSSLECRDHELDTRN